ncbi:hypothetical protein LVJ94_39470 [Pendulispora rubella]|uniref:Uncharacterized protein n=1 Tax=Pendulispora rubella TaxID=2741070 RepID=A0ABZ2KWB6_9BACT
MLELHRRVPGLTSVGAHTGVSSTDLLDGGLQRWLVSFAPPPNFGALSILYAAVGSEVAGGDYFGPRNWMPLNMLGIGRPPAKVELPARALDEALARELWILPENLSGVDFRTRRNAA